MPRLPAALALAATLLAACEPAPEFVASLSEPGQAKYEDWILGQWYQPESDLVLVTVADYQVYTALFPSPDDPPDDYRGEVLRVDSEEDYDQTMLQVTLVLQPEDGAGPSTISLIGFPSEIDGEIFYNFVRTRTPGLIGIPPGGTTAAPHYYRVREQAPGAADYTMPGEEPGHLIVRLFQPVPGTMVVCGLFFHGVREKGGVTEELANALADVGMAARYERVPVRINGVPVDSEDSDWSAVHTLADGPREALIELVRKDSGAYFHPVFVLTRLGAPWPEREEDPEAKAAFRALRDKCRIGGDG